MSADGDRFLIVRLGALGDVIHGIPVVAALRRQFPAARIDWLVDPRYVELLGCVRGLDDRIGVDPRAGMSALLKTVRELRRRRYSVTFDLQGLLKSAVLARLAGASRTVGFARRHLREPMARVFYSSQIEPGGAAHVIHQNLALLSSVGVTTDRIELPLHIQRTPASESIAREFGSSDYAVLNVGAGWPNKRWPPDQFGALAATLRERLGLLSLVLWGPGEQDLAKAVVTAGGGAATMSPPTTILDIMAIAAGAKLMISGDTGPVHLAGAVGTPVVGLYGPTNPLRNGPWSSQDVVVSRYPQCSCAYERRCHMPSRCIDAISVDEIVAAAQRRMQRP